jgi:hypothetical protein
VKLRCGAVGPGICAQALSIGAGVDDDECVAAAGPRTMAGAAEVAALCCKAWATECLEGVAGAAAPVIQEAGGKRARESSSENVRIQRRSSDQMSTAPSCADRTPFPEDKFMSGGVVLVTDAPRDAGTVNGATGSKRARPGYTNAPLPCIGYLEAAQKLTKMPCRLKGHSRSVLRGQVASEMPSVQSCCEGS